MNKWLITVTIVALAIAVPVLCTVAERVDTPSYGSGSIVLIEHLTEDRGSLINGSYPAPTLDGPRYLYDGFARQLTGSSLVVNDSLAAAIGVARSLVQDAGSGSEGQVFGLYHVPDIAAGIVLQSISRNGTVTLAYNGSVIVLSPGQRWETIGGEILSGPGYNLSVIKSDMIKNDGFVAKSSIT